jgi:cation-transporting ATPase 13A3/4/5
MYYYIKIQAYFEMALLITTVIIASGITKVIVSSSQQQKVLKMVAVNGTVRVLRDGSFINRDIKNLCPGNTTLIKGDLIQIESSGQSLSVDCVLISGDAVVDESSLTGEALPVAKTCIPEDNTPFSVTENGKRNCLFAGCNVLETHPSTGTFVTALVLSTGGGTRKGKLVRDMLHPIPIMFVFLEQLKIVVPILLFWGLVMFLFSIFMLGSNNIDSWFYGTFTISQILSPLLPAVLVIGQAIAAKRLAKKGIMCVDLQRITLAGKVKVFCFDKTVFSTFIIGDVN